MARLKLHLLGTPRIELDDTAVSTDRRKAVALLAYLAVSGTPHSREALAALLWPEADESSGLAYLRRTLWELNQMLGEGRLEADRSQITLAAEADLWLDLRQALARFADPADLAALADGAALVRGGFMAGFTLRDAPAFDDWQRFQANQVQHALDGALDALAAGHAARGAWETAVDHARRRVALDPLHEPAQRQLMGLYAQMGQKSAALQQFEACAQALQTELGIPPEPETRALYEQ
ncbi:MAG: hypothetical protein KC425_16055, partial [Anaerolineales bacterium]|nr:hypothetical protein [Anaerolineales bacterium]